MPVIPNLPSRSKKTMSGWKRCEFLLIFISAFMAYLLIWKGISDGNFTRHISNGLKNLQAGSLVATNGTPPFPLMDFFHGGLAAVFGEYVMGFPTLKSTAFIFGGVSLVLFYFILLEYKKEGLDLTDKGILVFMAVHPMFIISAGSSGDYIASLTTLLSAWLCVLKGELAAGAAFTGIAAGVRMANCLWAIPLAFLAGRKWSTPRACGYLFAAAVVGFLAFLPDMMRVHFHLGEWSGKFAEDLTWAIRIKSSVSYIMGFIGLPTLLITLATCRMSDYRASLKLMKKFFELPLILLVEYGFFTLYPYKLGYLISTLPAIALIIPQPPRRLFTYLRIFLVFLMNFVAFDVQNRIPTKFHLGMGYYVIDYTAIDHHTFLEKMRFSLPHGHYYPIGDWTERSD
jgi:hypothetical protein